MINDDECIMPEKAASRFLRQCRISTGTRRLFYPPALPFCANTPALHLPVLHHTAPPHAPAKYRYNMSLMIGASAIFHNDTHNIYICLEFGAWRICFRVPTLRLFLMFIEIISFTLFIHDLGH
jgi:hypothetical protein